MRKADDKPTIDARPWLNGISWQGLQRAGHALSAL